MQPRTNAWSRSGEDYYNGINDRHAVLNRSAAQLYFGRWRMILDGSIMHLDPQLRATFVRNTQNVQARGNDDDDTRPSSATRA
jgi:hypothetical protein